MSSSWEWGDTGGKREWHSNRGLCVSSGGSAHSRGDGALKIALVRYFGAQADTCEFERWIGWSEVMETVESAALPKVECP